MTMYVECHLKICLSLSYMLLNAVLPTDSPPQVLTFKVLPIVQVVLYPMLHL